MRMSRGGSSNDDFHSVMNFALGKDDIMTTKGLKFRLRIENWSVVGMMVLHKGGVKARNQVPRIALFEILIWCKKKVELFI
jgi:hypothetical protein